MIYTESNVSRESFIDINNSFWVGNTSLSKDKGYPEKLLDLGYAFLPSLEANLTGSGTGTFTLTASVSGLAVEIGTPSAESFILSSTAAFSGTVLRGDGTGTFTLTGSSSQIGVFLGVSTANTFTLSGSGAGILLGSGSGSGTFTLSATSVPAVGVHKGDGTGSFTLGLTSTPTLSLTLRYVLTRMNEEADPMSIRLTAADIDGVGDPESICLALDGSNEMSAGINAIAGTVNAPSLINQDDVDTGIYFPATDKLAVALGGIQKFLVENDGITFLVGTFGAKLTHSNTGNEQYELPNYSGKIFVGRSTSSGTYMTVEISTTAELILATNTDRIGGIITNNGDTIDLYIGFNSSVVAGTIESANGGIRITPGGSSFNLSQLSGYTGPLWGITSTGSTIVSVVEW